MSRGLQGWIGFAGVVVCAGLVAGCGARTNPAPEPVAQGPAAEPVAASPVGVQLRKSGTGWELVRNGTPFFVRGAGGEGSKDLLARLGGNAVRTWGTDGLQKKLDDAHRHNLAVAVGLWLAHERHGFDYSDPAQVAKQRESFREVILKYKDHPALLMWGIGNEVEGFEGGGKEAVWAAVNDVARLAKSLDPNHPTMAVVAEIGGKRVPSLHRLCPDIDIVGINTYAGAASVPERYRAAGGTKPYILTEFGPPGPWEVAKTPWGSPVEPTSSEKAIAYRRAYQKAVIDAGGLCLGSFAFLWGHKQETTATWFGMLLPDGTRLGAADALSTFWAGRPPANRCPVIVSLAAVGAAEVEPGATVRAKLIATDPEGDALTVRWVLQADPRSAGVGGDAEAAPPTFPEAVTTSDALGAEIRAPGGGAYRLFAYVSDGHGGAAVANVPVFVKGPPAKSPAGAPAKLPLVVYDEAGRKGAPYVASGYMGATKSLKLDERCETRPHGGKTCIRVDYAAPDGWAGVAWQHPADDWGDKPCGWDLTGAKRLSVWMRGETGDETVTIEFGILGREKRFPDTAKVSRADVRLSTEWREYTLDVPANADMTRIKTGFVFTLRGAGKPTTFFIDDCQFQ
ncbi:MAG TPA: glycoside hydrolase family 2 TIM barrel-domain containing protein [Urbifossiella sp.]|nr:glycoside hydrolase family 2 TIM barrel-domain containing protein [Urbifossiella sp.]